MIKLREPKPVRNKHKILKRRRGYMEDIVTKLFVSEKTFYLISFSIILDSAPGEPVLTK